MYANRLWWLLFVLSRRLLNVFRISTDPFRKGKRGEKKIQIRGAPLRFLSHPVTATRFRPESWANRSADRVAYARLPAERWKERQPRGGPKWICQKNKTTNEPKKKRFPGGLFSFTLLNTQRTISLGPRSSIASIEENGIEGGERGVGEPKKQKKNKGR